MLQLRPTFSESWYRVANLKVRLRPSAQISRQYHRGERWYVVRDPAGNQYHKISDPAYRFIALLDGSRTISDAWELVGGKMDDEAPTQPEVIQIINQLYSANLIEANVAPDSATLLKRHKMLSMRKFQQRLMNILFPRIPIWDPDRFLRLWSPLVNALMSPIGAVVWLLVVGLAIVTVAPMSGELARSASDSIAPGNWLALWCVFVFTKFIHEMGHAASCRRFGGECHEMGIMFLVFIPTPYVDASAAWSFPSRWARMFVGAAGMTVEIFFAALCAFVWASTGKGELIHQLAYNAMLIASVSTVLFNANPLLRYDGYYMLSDFLEIPNLQKKSTDYAMGLMKRHLFGVKAREPLPDFITRFWLFTYAISSSIYRIFVGIMIIVLVAFQVPVLGILMSLGGVVTWLVMPVYKSFKYLSIEPELHRKRGRAWAWSLGILTTAVLLLGIIPFPLWVRAEGVTDSINHQVVFSGAPGFIEEVLVRDGQAVAAGQTLLRMHDAPLETETAAARLNVEGARLKVRASRASNPSQAAIDEQEVRAYEKQLAEKEYRLSMLEVKAEVAGQVIGPRLNELRGRWLGRGQPLMMIAQTDKLEVRSLVTQEEAELIATSAQKDKTEIRPAGAIRQAVPATAITIVAAATDKLPHPALGHTGGGDIQNDPSDNQGTKAVTKQFELRIALPANAMVSPVTFSDVDRDHYERPLLSGQRAYVRVRVGERPIAWQVWRRFLQLIQSQKDSKSLAAP